MVAKVSQMFECPRCKTPMSDEREKPEKCPNCNFKFLKPGEEVSEQFSWGKPIPEQFFEMKQVMMEKFMDKPLDELIPDKIDAEKAKDLVVSNEMRQQIIETILDRKRDLFLLTTSADEVEGWIKSIWKLMSLSLQCGDKELVVKLAHWGFEIGKMAEALKKYVELVPEFKSYDVNKLQAEIKKFEIELETHNESDDESAEGGAE